ncbi:MGMT family protein, partial [Enterococcus casseliflavus]|uniref:MGMT family protein n=1 Tax=Enterococcus casseliflavus TaxID=37734 RepID=UPI003A4C5D02
MIERIKEGANSMNPFYEEVYALARQIPFGKVVSYSQIAWKLGQINGARAVGRAMRLSPQDVPA